MAEASNPKPAVQRYRLTGGINQKASEYQVGEAYWLDLRNVDFDVPNALQKRPGSTQAIALNTSGPITSISEFTKLTGQSFVIAGSDTAMFYMSAFGGTLLTLDTGWNNGQPTDQVTFVNKQWMANGQNYKSWDGVSTLLSAGMPCAPQQITGLTTILTGFPGAYVPTGIGQLTVGAQWAPGATGILVGGATSILTSVILGITAPTRGVFLAYSYIRSDGMYGAIDIQNSARNVVRGYSGLANGAEFFAGYPNLGGFTIPSGYGISGVAVWIAPETVGPNLTTETIPLPDFSGIITPTAVRTGSNGLGWRESIAVGSARIVCSASLLPNAAISRFRLYQTIEGASLGLTTITGVTMYAYPLAPLTGAGAFDSYNSAPGVGEGVTGMPFCFWDTNTPKYLDINQNTMFMAGFSANPSTVWFSDLAQPEIISSPEQQFEVRTNDGDRVYAIKTFNNQLMIFKGNSFHKVVGDTADNYELIELSTEYGCISNQAVVEYREKLLFLDQKGIVEFNGASWDIISNDVEDIFRRMNLTAAREKACAVHQLYRNQVWFGIPVDGSDRNNITVVFDYLVGAWTFFDGFNPSTFGFVKSALTKPTVWRGDFSGNIHYFNESLYGDNGIGISCTGRSSWEHGAENDTWIWRRLFLDVATVTGLTGVINGRVFSDYNFSTVQATFAMYQNAFQSRAEMGVVGKAAAYEFSHNSASLPLLLNGYTWARRFLRNL